MTVIAGVIGVVLLLVILWVVLYFVLWLLRALWRGATTDWFGMYHEDKDSPYYHDKTGEGKGHRS